MSVWQLLEEQRLVELEGHAVAAVPVPREGHELDGEAWMVQLLVDQEQIEELLRKEGFETRMDNG